MITARIPGGNIKVLSINGHDIELDVDRRDSANDWFYWSFLAAFPEPGVYRFHFATPGKVGSRGPAVSRDRGQSWQWRYQTPQDNSQKFDYECQAAGQEVLFCVGMQYLQHNLDAFLAEFSSKPALTREVLCRSRKGREVELTTIREGSPSHTVLLTARHHAGEMMASHVLEGIMRATLSESDFGKKFRRNIALYTVPFVDKDGVEEGDQGKNRLPHDYARDYQDPGLYPETIALRQWIETFKPDFILDLHCPLLTGNRAYLVGTGDPKMDAAMEQFSRRLDALRIADAPYFRADNLPFGSGWNTAKNYTQGLTIKHYALQFPFVACAQIMEIPFANFGAVTVDRPAMLHFGATIAQAILDYLMSEVSVG